MNAAEEKKCKVAFVGAGYMTSEHLKAFSDISNVALSGIFSRTAEPAENLAREFGIGAVSSSVDELYEQTEADLVVISVPELSVGDVSEECFSHPWVALIEKPAGYDLADAEKISASARAADRRAFVALNRRHYSSTKAVLADLETNYAPRFIHIQDQEDAVAALNAGQPKLVVENWMYANSIHLIDYFTILGRGKVTKVEPVIQWNPDNPGIVAAKILFESGDIGLYEAVWNAPGPWAIAVTTKSKRWEMRPVEQAAFQNYGERTLDSVTPHKWDQEFKPGLRRQAELAVQAAMGESPPELPDLEDALASMRLIRDIYEVS